MTVETFIKLCQGTREDFMIACNWLVTYHNPIKYIQEHSNSGEKTPNCNGAILWNHNAPFWDLGNCIYYRYKDIYIIRSSKGITITDKNYDDSAEVINH